MIRQYSPLRSMVFTFDKFFYFFILVNFFLAFHCVVVIQDTFHPGTPWEVGHLLTDLPATIRLREILFQTVSVRRTHSARNPSPPSPWPATICGPRSV
jgi:hypothetical protein